jgi:hypothetical protein
MKQLDLEFENFWVFTDPIFAMRKLLMSLCGGGVGGGEPLKASNYLTDGGLRVSDINRLQAFKYYLRPNQTHEPDKVKPVINCFACTVVFMP